MPLGSKLLLWLLLGQGHGAKRGPRPPRVRSGARDYGGGDRSLPGHLRPVRELPASPVDELSDAPSWAHFYHNYVRANRPVLIRGHAARQQAYGLWTDAYLAETWGSTQIDVEVNKTEERGGATLKMTFTKFLQEIYKEEREKELYGILNFDGDVKAKQDFTIPEPLACKEVVPQSLTLWMSSGGTSSVIHQDDAENFLMVLAGRKIVLLAEPDEVLNVYGHIAERGGTSPVHQEAVDLESFPRFAKVSWLKGELGPGDTLYIPHSYWHQVYSVGRNVAANLWWGHTDDWRWWEIGAEGSSLASMKQNAMKDAPCTPFPKGATLADATFVDEGSWKDYLLELRSGRSDL